MKKFISIICAAAMVVSSMSAVAAEPEAEDINASLLSRGYPQLYLDNISESAKESLYDKSDAVFDGATVTVFDEATGESFSYDISADGISAQGQIPSGDLVLTWGISRHTTTGNVLITYSYTWKKHPVFRFQDPIGIAWDDTCFEMVDNSFYKVDKYQVFPSGEVVTKTHSEARNYASASSCGVTWYADLPGHHLTHDLFPIFGHGEFLLRPKKTGSFTTTFYGHYVHQTVSGSISLIIPKYGAGFSVSGGLGYDELGNQRTYTY